jgi:hypothetical protein
MYNILDLANWRATQVRVDKMARDVAQEALDTEGWCPMEGKVKRGSKRAHQESAYAALRTYFFWVSFSNYGSFYSAVNFTRPLILYICPLKTPAHRFFP